MDVAVRRKGVSELNDTRLVQQTTFWGRLKRKLGWNPLALDIEADGRPAGDLLLLSRDVGNGASVAYAPFGPEKLPERELRGLYLSALSSIVRGHLDPGCVLVRWDLPWTSPYAEDEDRYDAEGNWLGPPETRVRELRMNWGVGEVGLRKAPSDILPPDTMIVDIRGDEESLLARMKPKTRYNIRLSRRKGVRVREGGMRDLGLWQRLYEATARRNGIVAHGKRFFSAMLEGEVPDPGIRLLVAEADRIPLAAMFLSTSADGATYLYGASSGELRHLMAPYALQWAAIKLARERGCASYDMFGVAPGPNPGHPMHGLYAFKSGFGGRLVHRQGAWDYPYDESAYGSFVAGESASPGFNA